MEKANNSEVTLIAESDGVRVQTGYRIGFDGFVEINITVPVFNPTLLEAQAIACENVANGLLDIANNFRSIIGEHSRADT